MNRIRMAALAGACLLAAPSAWADDTYTVDRVVINGSHTVPQQKLLAAIQSRPGAKVTKDDIIADQATIVKMLEDAHVGGGVKTSMASRGTHIVITFALDDQGVQAPVVTKVAPKFDHQVFAGNTKVSTADLEAATGLKPGQELSNDAVKAAQQGIADAYKKVKRVSMSVTGGIKQGADGRVEIDWQITETKGPKKEQSKDLEEGTPAEP